MAAVPQRPPINERSSCLCSNGPFRIQPSQPAGQGIACLFLCTCSLSFFLSFNSFSPFSVQTARPLPYLSDACPIDLFVSAPLMVPSFGDFVSAPPVIVILCETEKRESERKRGEKKWNKNESPNGFDDAVAGGRACVRLCVCFVVGSIVGPWECSPPTCSRWGISGKLV